MRILLVCERLDGTGGWSRYSANLRSALRGKGHEVRTCTRHGGGGDFENLPPPIHMMTRPYLVPIVKRVIAKANNVFLPDVIHFTVEPYALAIPKKLRRKSIITFHGNYGIRPLRFWLSRRSMLNALREVHTCITVSKFTQDTMMHELQTWPKVRDNFHKKTRVIANGIPMPHYVPRDPQKAGHQILFVGAVKGSKGVHEAILGCIAYGNKYGGQLRFSIVGSLDFDPSMCKKPKDWQCKRRSKALQNFWAE